MKAHARACRKHYNGYEQFLNAVATCLDERKEPEDLGLFAELKDQEFTATILILCNIFNATQPVNLALQKGDGSLCLSDLPVNLKTTLLALEKVKFNKNWQKFTKDNLEPF